MNERKKTKNNSQCKTKVLRYVLNNCSLLHDATQDSIWKTNISHNKFMPDEHHAVGNKNRI